MQGTTITEGIIDEVTPEIPTNSDAPELTGEDLAAMKKADLFAQLDRIQKRSLKGRFLRGAKKSKGIQVLNIMPNDDPTATPLRILLMKPRVAATAKNDQTRIDAAAAKRARKNAVRLTNARKMGQLV